MKLPDTNLLVYCANKDSPHHASAVAWFEAASNGAGGVGFAWLALVGFLRITTQPKLMARPLSVAQATQTVDEWLAHPRSRILQPTERHADLVSKFLLLAGTAGNLTNDAHLAALSVEHGCTVGTYDRDFKKFPGIRLDFLS